MKNRNYEIDNARRLLGISKTATEEDAKKGYRKLARIWHPDINTGEEAHVKMQEINRAYDLLMREEFGILDPWDEVEKWWWQRFGNDPIWGNYFPGEDEGKPAGQRGKKKILVNDKGDKK